jgi:hypothetical protein
MKLRILLIGLILISSCTPKGEESLAANQKKDIRNRLQQNEYQGAELQSFYADFKNQIQDITWTDEPPAKLAGVVFKLDDKTFIEVDLVEIPDSVSFNINRDWTIEKVGTSKIESLTLIDGDFKVQEQK